jgi:hypothetical protein
MRGRIAVEEEPRPSGVELARQVRAEARRRAESAVREMAAQFGSRTLARGRPQLTAWPQRDSPSLEAAAALEAAHELERAAHALAGTYIRRAREAGLPWNLIGGALDLLPYASANKIGAGEQAHEYALSYWAGPGPRACTWDCPACQQTITDRGPGPGPPADEDGHDPACPRRTAELVARERRRPRWQRGQAGLPPEDPRR